MPSPDEGEESREEDDGPKAKTRLSKILSNVVVVQKNGEEGSNEDDAGELAVANEVLGTVKFDADVVQTVESNRKVFTSETRI